MSGILSREECAYLSELKISGKFKKFTQDDMKNAAKNGGVAIMCGDGDVNIFDFHQSIISKRAHCIRLFGGPLLLCPSFRGFDLSAKIAIMENIS